MKFILLLISLLFIDFCLFAQKGPLIFLGYAKDSVSGVPLEKAAIQLKNDKEVLRSLTDEKGYFKFENLSPGSYTIFVDYSGYIHYTRVIEIADSTSSVSFFIGLVHQDKLLQDVVITVTKSLVENKPDRIIYNVEKDITSQGGVATDVLRKVPQVTVDINGNVELLGNPSVKFLINGKSSTIFGNSVADALQSIPASQIQSIEVMSSPGAKYDASGTGGIINIILKKNRSQGFSGVINATAGTRLENGSLNLNYKKNAISFNAYFNGSTQVRVRTLSELTRNSVDTAAKNNYFLHQQGSSDFNRNSFRSGLGMDWDITSRDNLSLSLGYDHFGNSNKGRSSQENSEKDKNGYLITDEKSLRNAYTTFNNKSLDLSADYRRKFRKDKEELSISLLYSSEANNSYYSQYQQYVSNDSIFSGSHSKNPGKDHLSSIAIDYADPVSNNLLWETGVKLETEKLISDAAVFTFSPPAGDYVFDNGQSYSSVFKRQVYSAYTSGSFKLFRQLNVISGLRLEHTINTAFYSNSGKTNIPDYNNLCPSITISHTFEKKQLIKFSYAYRLERPEYRDLNPFVNLSDPHNISTGNPNILPEIGHDFQLGFSQDFGKENNLSVTLVFTHNSPDIKSYTTFYPSYKVGDSTYYNVNVTRRSNIASENRYGININGAVIVGKLTIRPNIQLYDRQVNNIYSIPQKISGFEYRGNINCNYQFNKLFVVEAFGNYRSGTKWQGTQAAFYSYSIAMRHQLFKGKGSIGFVAVDPFGKYVIQKTSQEAIGFTASSRLQIPYRSFGINFLYKFGKLKINKPKEADNLLNNPPPDSQ